MPYVKLAEPEAVQKDKAATEAYILQRHVDYERLKEASERLNSALLARITSYLDDFYSSREISQDVKLVAELNYGRILLKNDGFESQIEGSLDEKSTKLSAYQGEMEEFGSFLEQKFFSEN